jgi:CheY-like chemotaxis protein
MYNTRRSQNLITSIATILYVDDNPKSRRFLGSVLIDCGFEVITTGDPVEAIREFGKLCLDGALIDYRLPIISGPDLALKLKTLYPDVPVVVLSGVAVLPDRELLCLDAHFGSGTSLDDLLVTLRTLTCSQAARRIRATAASWAETT